ncbi:MAG: RNA polymerase sigma factor [Alphaproteobacteria bacterium]|nr:RNA polymerase sigma factor [Alphaproteobacteria bacterium]
MATMSKIIYLAASDKRHSNRLLEEIHSRFDPDLRRFIRVRCKSEEELEDILQSLYLRLAGIEDLADRLSKSPDTVLSYLFTIIVNLHKDMKRKAISRHHDKHVEIDEQMVAASEVTPDNILDWRQRLRQAERVLKGQKKIHVKAFMLNRFQGLSYREIAGELDVSISSVEKYISLVLCALREELRR